MCGRLPQGLPLVYHLPAPNPPLTDNQGPTSYTDTETSQGKHQRSKSHQRESHLPDARHSVAKLQPVWRSLMPNIIKW